MYDLRQTAAVLPKAAATFFTAALMTRLARVWLVNGSDVESSRAISMVPAQVRKSLAVMSPRAISLR
jgi:hypothetical protein